MTGTHPRRLLGITAVMLVVAAAVWQMPLGRQRSASAFPPLNSSLEPLRTEFMQAAGEVRIVMLIDPT